MTLAELIARAQQELNARIARYNENVAKLNTQRGATEVDETHVTTLREANTSLNAEMDQLRARITEMQEEQRRDEAVARLQATSVPVGTPPSTGRQAVVQVGSEPRTYSRESDPKGKRFLSDVLGAYAGDREASARIDHHLAEERTERPEQVQRAVTTGSAPGTIIPQYLVDLYAAKGRPGRHFADQCRSHELPATGMTVYIPRQTALTSADNQANELDPLSESDYDDELIPVPVRTCGGTQTISRQWSERGVGSEEIVLEDLLKSCDNNLDTKLLNAPTWGLLAVANTITYTDADPTAQELYLKIQGGVAAAEDTLQDVDEGDVITLMRGSRWKWMTSSSTDKWPFINRASVPASFSWGVNNEQPYPVGIRGLLPDGGGVVTDNNLPKNQGTATNQDVVVVVAKQEAHLWEDPAAPFFIRAEQTKSKTLGIDLVVYCYYAAVFDRLVDDQGTPKAVHQQIVGTGLVPPVF